jgi:hypothetical protein
VGEVLIGVDLREEADLISAVLAEVILVAEEPVGIFK